MEIWCINANSPDERDNIIPQKFPVTYIKLPERVGVYAAWNHIIRNSNSEYITNANADDLIAPDGYERLMYVLDRSKQDSFVYPSWYTTSTPNLKWDQIVSSKLASPDGTPGSYKGDLGTSGVGHFPMWRRSLHSRLGLFDENFKALGDADWWARCFHIGNCNFKWLNNFLSLKLLVVLVKHKRL
jgi:glycosyltransferase involved in cell wall biosynthesis